MDPGRIQIRSGEAPSYGFNHARDAEARTAALSQPDGAGTCSEASAKASAVQEGILRR